MSEEEKKLLDYSKFGKLWKKTRPHHQEYRPVCYTNGCSNRSSRNHLLKQKGIVSQICGLDNHVRELRTNRFRYNEYYSFERIGWEQSISMYGYCPTCDGKLFSSIENPTPLLPSKVSEACLYSLRPVVHEIRKKQGNIFFLRQLDKHKPYAIPELSPLNQNILGVELLESIAKSLVNGLTDDTIIDYSVRELPRIEVCASSILLRPIAMRAIPMSDVPEKLRQATKISRNSFNIINLFPLNSSSIMISATHKEADDSSQKFQEFTQSASIDALKVAISNMLIAQIEDWCVSKLLHSKLPNNIEKIITHAKANQATMFNHDFGFSFFDLY